MAFGDGHKVTDPNSGYGEVWHTHVTQAGSYFGLIFLSAVNSVSDPVKPSQLGLSLEGGGAEYLVSSYANGLSGSSVVTANSDLELPEQENTEFDIWYMSPLWEITGGVAGEKVAFVGDLTKYVPFSRGRFPEVAFQNQVGEVGGSLTVTSVGNVADLSFAFVTSEGIIEELTVK